VLLPLLSLDKLEADEAGAVRSHLATCASCRRQLSDFDSLRNVLRREDAADPNIGPVLTMQDILSVTGRVAVPSVPRRVPVTRPLGRSSRLRDQLAAMAAVLLLVTLAGLIFASRGRPGRVGMDTGPALDAASQDYVGVLRTYYAPMAVDNVPAKSCLDTVGNTLPDELGAAQLMPTCRPLVAAELTAARTFVAQLATTTPPARWRTQDVELRQATLGLIPILTAWLGMIDARDTSQIAPLEDRTSPALSLFFDPITRINSDLHVGPPPLTAPLPILEGWFN
jgi:hypothetical protein